MVNKKDFFELHQKYSHVFDYNLAVNNSDWNKVKDLYNNFVLSDDIIIPKKIHQIWLGGSLPDKYKRLSETWQKYNPDYEYKLWNENSVKELSLYEDNINLIENITNPGMKSDVLRYLILYEHGGTYVDTDFECLKSIDDFHKLSFYSGLVFSKNVEVAIGIIGTIKEHPIIKSCIDNLIYIGENNWHDIFNSTGSWFFTKQILNYINNIDNRDLLNSICLFPTIYFYPLKNDSERFIYNNLERDYLNDVKNYITEDSAAIHWWASSWLNIR
jgi:mannosyltransferase OCH1-like enzyme